MNAIDWMLTHGDVIDHALAVSWHKIPDGKEGGHARMDLVREFSGQFARARIEANAVTMQQSVGGAK